MYFSSCDGKAELSVLLSLVSHDPSEIHFLAMLRHTYLLFNNFVDSLMIL